MFRESADQPKILVGINAALKRKENGPEGVWLHENESCLLVLDKVYTSLIGLNEVHEFTCIEGRLLVTSFRVIFAATNTGEQYDLSIDAELVLLHAVSGEKMYLQLDLQANMEESESEAETEDVTTYSPVELYFVLKAESGQETDIEESEKVEDIEELLGQLFDALSTMAELNPDEDENDDYADNEGGFDGGEFFFIADEKALEDGSNIDKDKGATEEERMLMLSKLDSVLTVPAELELDENGERINQQNLIIDDQFADADEDDDIL